MRTTVTLDDNLAVRLETLRAEQRLSFKEALNKALKAGLAEWENPSRVQRQKTAHPPMHLGEPRIPYSPSTAEMLAVAEGEEYK